VTDMENGLTLENITKGLLAIGKIKDMLESNLREDGDVAIKQDKLTAVQETLLLLGDFLPKMRSGSFSEALSKSSRYSRAYREIKGHIRNTRNTKTNFNKVAKAIKAVAPILDNRQKVYFDKLIKIMDILNS
jgi:hypothetical protein